MLHIESEIKNTLRETVAQHKINNYLLSLIKNSIDVDIGTSSKRGKNFVRNNYLAFYNSISKDFK